MDVLKHFNLDGQVAIVTGASRGIGRAIALTYAEAGADVVCVARTQADIDATADEISQLGRQALAIACDVNELAELGAVVDAAMAKFGQITHLVNNAGGSGPNDPLKMSTEKFEGVFRFNVSPAYELTRLCVPHMRSAGAGNVINVTSVAARYAQKHFSAYGTAKAALTHLTRLFAQEFAPTVRVNAISPGPIMTEALARVLSPDMREVMAKNTPMGRLGLVEDIAAAALYLATPASSWVTGKILEIDGGAESSVWPG